MPENTQKGKRMNYWFDTEFIDNTKTIDLISIGIVSEDNRTYYAVSNEFDASTADRWVTKHVLNQLPPDSEWKSRETIKQELLRFIGKTKPHFWVYNGAYDWVIMCQLFGHMRDLPKKFPWFAFDIKQLWHEVGCPDLPPFNHGKAHNALDDALWTKQSWEYLERIKRGN